jgi:glycerol kinase
MTGEPLVVIIRWKSRSSSLLEGCVPRNGVVESVGKTTGLLFNSAISTHYVETISKDGEGNEVKDYKGVKYVWTQRRRLVSKVLEEE